MRVEKMNPAAPSRAQAGSGSSISSPAITSDNISILLALKAIRSRVAVSEPLAMAIAEMAGLGGDAALSFDNQRRGTIAPTSPAGEAG